MKKSILERLPPWVLASLIGLASMQAQAQAQAQSPTQIKRYELGRLFLSAEQRSEIDQPGKKGMNGGAQAPKIDGVVQRSGGRTVIWVDGVAQHEWPVVLKAKSGSMAGSPAGPLP